MVREITQENVREQPPPSNAPSKTLQDLLPNRHDPVEMEVGVYMGLTLEELGAYSGVLDFWKQNCLRFPNVAKLASKILCIPGSSASAERSHAALKNTVPPARSRLEHETIKYLMSMQTLEKYSRTKPPKR